MNTHTEYIKQHKQALNRLDAKEITMAEFKSIRPQGKDFDLIHGDFIKADLRYADLNESVISRAKFYRANLSNAELENATANETDFTSVNFTGADLYGMDVIGAWFTNADLTKATTSRMTGGMVDIRNITTQLHTDDIRVFLKQIIKVALEDSIFTEEEIKGMI